MRLVLHIGANKTGSKTLQTTFRAHARTLARARILYPTPSQHPFNHGPLVCLFKPPDRMPRAFTSKGSDAPSLRRMGEECWREIVGQVRASDAETCILSSEYFFGLRELGELAERLCTEFDEVRVVAYVRSPASMYLSTMQQHVKASFRITAPEGFRYRVRDHLTRHMHVFGDNVTVRPFDRSMLVGGCIVQDFVSTALPTTHGLASEIQVQDQNESLSAEAVCILQDLRRYGWPKQDGRIVRECTRAMRALEDMARRSPQTRLRLKPGIAAKLTEAQADDLEWLRERFGIGFEADEEPWTEQGEPEGWSSDRFLDILDLDREHVDRILFELVKELMTSTDSQSLAPSVLGRGKRLLGHLTQPRRSAL